PLPPRDAAPAPPVAAREAPATEPRDPDLGLPATLGDDPIDRATAFGVDERDPQARPVADVRSVDHVDDRDDVAGRPTPVEQDQRDEDAGAERGQDAAQDRE